MWVNKLNKEGIDNVNIIVEPYDFSKSEAFMESGFFKALGPDMFFDVILIDGYEECKQLRPYCFKKAEKHIQKGGVIVVDDSWRYPELRRENNAKKVIQFKSVGPCRYGVTSTDIFMY